MMKRYLAISLTLGSSLTLGAQQIPDTTYRPPIASVAYGEGKGPVVCLDEGHANFPYARGTIQVVWGLAPS